VKRIVFGGIQQIGIGVKDLREAWAWYRKVFGVDIRIFEDEAVADLMLPYTGGKPRRRHAAMALNLMGGGGFEIWQYKDREPQPPKKALRIGDLGINIVKVKSKDVAATYEKFRQMELQILGDLKKDPSGNDVFFLRDPWGNIFEVVTGKGWFRNERKNTGAAYGAIIGTTDIDRSYAFYKDILGFDMVVYDQEGIFEDLSVLPGGEYPVRRMMLEQSAGPLGVFSKVFGPAQLELVQVKGRTPEKIFAGRYWGDLGFIHICFDIRGMENLKKKCREKGFPFTVDSKNSFDMGEAAGHFSYIEDPDGTLIEFVETHRLPIIKKLGWYVDLRKRDPEKSLPNWLLKALRFNRVKEKKKKK
jgi:catechol 2,3-dioxygenase-like lactoylglutathione lyase family enzyme